VKLLWNIKAPEKGPFLLQQTLILEDYSEVISIKMMKFYLLIM